MASTINAASAATLISNKTTIISASSYPAAVFLLALSLCQPVQARLRLYKLVIEESVPALDHVQTLVEEKPDDMAHHFIGHAIGVELPWIHIWVGVHVVDGIKVTVLMQTNLRGELFHLRYSGDAPHDTP